MEKILEELELVTTQAIHIRKKSSLIAIIIEYVKEKNYTGEYKKCVLEFASIKSIQILF